MMRIRAVRRMAALAALILLFVPSQHVSGAIVLYGATAAGLAGELYVLDSATGMVLQDIGPLNDANGLNFGITGMAYNPVTGVLYGSTHNLSTADPATQAKLVTIDPLTARVTVVGSFNAGNIGARPATMADIGFDSNGLLYGVGSIGGPNLYSINPASGQATAIGSTGLTSTSGGGIAVSVGGTIYGTPTSSRFGTYDLPTGAFTNIANPVKPVGGAYAALDFDSSTGNLWGLDLGPDPGLEGFLVTIDLATGVVTNVGSSVMGLDAIAFVPIPEPAASALIAVSAISLFRRRRER
jgi:hypothetical protein